MSRRRWWDGRWTLGLGGSGGQIAWRFRGWLGNRVRGEWIGFLRCGVGLALLLAPEAEQGRQLQIRLSTAHVWFVSHGSHSATKPWAAQAPTPSGARAPCPRAPDMRKIRPPSEGSGLCCLSRDHMVGVTVCWFRTSATHVSRHGRHDVSRHRKHRSALDARPCRKHAWSSPPSSSTTRAPPRSPPATASTARTAARAHHRHQQGLATNPESTTPEPTLSQVRVSPMS